MFLEFLGFAFDKQLCYNIIVPEGEPKKPNLEGDKSDKIPNKLAYPGPVGTALNLLALSALANMPESNLDNLLKQYTNPDRKILETLDGLPNGPDDIYIFLFERDKTPSGMDDLIAEAGKLKGNKIGLHWHVEVVYYGKVEGEVDWKWMAMGCRPTGCTRDKPLADLQKEMRGYTVNIQHVKVPEIQRENAVIKFDKDFKGKAYSLAGQSKTNCTDAAFGLAKAAGLADETIIRSASLKELKESAGIEAFKENYLSKLDPPCKEVEEIMQRDTIIFPDEFAKIGKYVRSVKFGNMQF